LKGNDSVSGNIKIEYRFHEKLKNEVLQTEFSLINRSTKALTYKAADMKLHSTAYPQLNIVAGLRYQHALGHIELHIEVNTSPHLHNADRHKLTAQFVATYSKPYFQTDGIHLFYSFIYSLFLFIYLLFININIRKYFLNCLSI
jgi:hypothetical protein